MRGEVPAICWSAGTDCSTIAKCGDQFKSCTAANAHYDCTEMRCVFGNSTGDGGTSACGDPAFPVSCPARGDVPALCWSAGTVCSTLVRCGNDFKSCLAPGYHFSCTENKCVADGTGAPADAGATPTDTGAPADTAAPADAASAADAGADAASGDTHD